MKFRGSLLSRSNHQPQLSWGHSVLRDAECPHSHRWCINGIRGRPLFPMMHGSWVALFSLLEAQKKSVKRNALIDRVGGPIDALQIWWFWGFRIHGGSPESSRSWMTTSIETCGFVGDTSWVFVSGSEARPARSNDGAGCQKARASEIHSSLKSAVFCLMILLWVWKLQATHCHTVCPKPSKRMHMGITGLCSTYLGTTKELSDGCCHRPGLSDVSSLWYLLALRLLNLLEGLGTKR